MRQYFAELGRRRDLLIYLVISGLKAQHRNTFLGYFWWLLDPLLGLLVYYFVVVIVFQRGGPDYGVYLVIGMVCWRWLSSTIVGAARSIVSQAGIITQVYLPKAIFPLGMSLSQLVNFGFGLIVVALFLALSGFSPNSQLVWLPWVIVAQLIFQTALAMLVAYICTFVRDIDAVMSHLMRLWFYGSPVIWSQDMIPSHYHWILEMNPMAHFLGAYRGILMQGQTPDLAALSGLMLLSASLIVLMTYFYSQHEHRLTKAL